MPKGVLDKKAILKINGKVKKSVCKKFKKLKTNELDRKQIFSYTPVRVNMTMAFFEKKCG
ncbi:MAG: hypothetical protein ABMA02_13290 [Saprospiraceae bacterium]